MYRSGFSFAIFPYGIFICVFVKAEETIFQTADHVLGVLLQPGLYMYIYINQINRIYICFETYLFRNALSARNNLKRQERRRVIHGCHSWIQDNFKHTPIYMYTVRASNFNGLAFIAFTVTQENICDISVATFVSHSLKHSLPYDLDFYCLPPQDTVVIKRLDHEMTFS